MKNFLLILILSFALAGCGPEDDTSSTTDGGDSPNGEANAPDDNPPGTSTTQNTNEEQSIQCLSSLTGNYTGSGRLLFLEFPRSYTLEVNSGNNADGTPEIVFLMTFFGDEKVCALISEPSLVADATEEAGAETATTEEADADAETDDEGEESAEEIADADADQQLSGTFNRYSVNRRVINGISVSSDCSSLTLNSRTTPEKDTEGTVLSFEEIKTECTSLN